MAISRKRKQTDAYAPVERPVTKKLMGNQDVKHKGDSTGYDSVPMTFRCPTDLKAEAKAYSGRTGIPMTRLIIEGLEWRLRR